MWIHQQQCSIQQQTRRVGKSTTPMKCAARVHFFPSSREPIHFFTYRLRHSAAGLKARYSSGVYGGIWLPIGQFVYDRSLGQEFYPSYTCKLNHAVHRGVVTGWTGVDTSTPLFPRVFLGFSRWGSVLISFRLYPHTLTPTWEGTPLPHLTHTVHPTLFDLATPLDVHSSVAVCTLSHCAVKLSSDGIASSRLI